MTVPWRVILRRLGRLQRESRSRYVRERTTTAIRLTQQRKSAEAMTIVRNMGMDELRQADRILAALEKAVRELRGRVGSRLDDLSRGSHHE